MGIAGPQVLAARDCDVAVVGGGPAGLIAARDLAAAGHHVILVEEHDTVGTPVHCTGVLGADAFDELDLPRETILAVAHAARFVSADRSTVRISAERVSAAVVDRNRFDRALAGRAGAAGVDLRSGQRAVGIEASEREVTVRTSSGAIRARACVVACGASYRFNRALGLGLPKVFGHSAQAEVPFDAMDDIEVHLGRDVAPGGFGWVVPFRRDGESFARIGVMCENGARRHFAALVERLHASHPIDADTSRPRLKVLPLAPVRRTFGHRVVAVGDAAGLVKPTTGGGIYYGLLSGRIASEVLADALRADRLDAAALGEYERRWRARLWSEIRAGLAFRAVTSRLNDGAINALFELARVDGIVPLLTQTADFNWHRKAAVSLLRNPSFRRIVLTSIWR